MKIAITADNHLTTRHHAPERYHALENILYQMMQHGIKHLIIAGDLFDVDTHRQQNFSEFETICKQHSKVQFHIIPGNHDQGISKKSIVGENIAIYDKPAIISIDDQAYPFLFIPYDENVSMGEQIAASVSQLELRQWVLIGHGDWIVGTKRSNAYEQGVYMPLARRDLDQFQPRQVFLGHIHAAGNTPIHYAGSPCGLDINETGHRRFLVYDTETNQIESRWVDTDVLYFNTTLTILPLDDEETYLKPIIAGVIQSWNLNQNEKKKARIRVKVRGYSSDKDALTKIVKDAFEDFTFYHNEFPDMDEVFFSEDFAQQHIVELVQGAIDEMEWYPADDIQPDKEMILLSALKVIYGA
jgi:DNA repair protein SbcD/Mre11